ncbi:MAG: hypothetical protein SFW35_00815 [Chitinophagales bacterium]|nr:hypothetical protein [Chitinophagales bacterium]
MKGLLIHLLLMLSILCSAQKNALILGNLVLVDGTHSKLRKAIFTTAKVGTYKFHNTVGGVSFEQTAQPDASLENKKPFLSYNAAAPDGERLTVSFSGIKGSYKVPLPDWQMIPTAFFAQSGNNAVVSIFGQNIDTTYAPIVYDTALLNTLLGLRIFEADLLYTGRINYWDLPKNAEGKTILAKSETKFAPESIPDSLKEYAASVLDGTLGNIQNTIEAYDSYILTDHDMPVFVSLVNEDLSISGEPYYLFTKFSIDFLDYAQQFSKIIKARPLSPLPDSLKHIEKMIKELSDIEYSWQGKNLMVSINQLAFPYQEADSADVPPVLMQLFLASYEAIEASRKNVVFNKLTTGIMEQLTPYMYVINPAVVTAFVNTMRYAAFFRYVKQNNPQNWLTFLTSIKGKEKNDGIKDIYTPIDHQRQE